MAISFQERPKSGTMTWNPPTLDKLYVLSGVEQESVAYAWVLGLTPASISSTAGILFRQTFTMERIGHQLYHVTVPYGRYTRDLLEYTFSANTTGGTANKRGGTHIATFPSSAANHGGLIGVNKAGDVEGIDVVIPVLDLEIKIKYAMGHATMAWLKTLMDITGCVNNAPFLGWAAGEMLYRGVNMVDGTHTECEVAHHFSVSPNVVDVTIAGITGISKKGWEAGWIQWESDASGNEPHQKALAFHVDQVYRSVSFPPFLGFGP